MFTELLRKWFGLEVPRCESCEILREQLVKSERERSELLHRILDKDNKSEPPPPPSEELKPIGQSFVPWRVRQQMLEAEDRKQAELLKRNAEEIKKLEKVLDIVQ